MNESQPLTKQDIAALRTADHLEFSYSQGEGGRIRAIKDASEACPWEQGLDLYVQARLRIYGHYDDPNPPEVTSAKYRLSVDPYGNQALPTALAILQPADMLWLEFIANGGCGYLTTAGLFSDELRLHIDLAKPRGGLHCLSFNLATYITREVWARMVKLAPRAVTPDDSAVS